MKISMHFIENFKIYNLNDNSRKLKLFFLFTIDIKHLLKGKKFLSS